MSRSRRARALGFGAVALLCALGSAALAARHRDGVEASFGALRSVVVVRGELEARKVLAPGSIERLLEVRRVPERFAPSDALAEPEQALGAAPRGAVPAGSYLLASHLRGPGRPRPSPLGGNRSPIEVRVAAAGALRRGGGRRRVDVIAAREPGIGAGGKVVVLARSVPLLALRADEAAEGEERGWVATLGLARRQALAVIEAENFSREIRLLPR